MPCGSRAVADGRVVVGRYLTNVEGSTLNKKIQTGELSVILGAGLRVFPIFQTLGDSLSYFSDAQGYSDAGDAVQAATGYGFVTVQVVAGVQACPLNRSTRTW